ncbi:hypothetical protein GDO81_023444 [Engystomops pustulosus]|uniref:Uncharacterized protein n=1 Tax=Engystomops pustulosus TaxID=76066 RepID=A0AAV6ZBM5_ENGPU|nr:hypothetical protein GDO81_023444 [Engystomops pustulosus]
MEPRPPPLKSCSCRVRAGSCPRPATTSRSCGRGTCVCPRSWSCRTEHLQMDNEVLRQQVEDLKNKNLLLRAQLRHHGVEIVIKNDAR